MLCTQVIGRVEELSRLYGGLDSLSAGGRGSCILLVGEAGLGKSRLVAETVAEAGRRGVTVLAGRATATGTAVPYQPLTGALLQSLRSRQWTGVAEALPPGLSAALPGFADGPTPPASPVLLAEAVLRLARVLGDGRGTLLVLEDLHWADAETLAVLEYLADNAPSEPILVLATTRPEGDGSALIGALHRRAMAEVSTLAPLTFAEVGEMVASCLGQDAVPESIIRGVDARAEGVPFLVEELLAGLVNRGRLVLAASGWQLSHDPGEDVPVSFAQTVRDRLAELGPDGAAVLQAAAVLGREFDWHRLAGAAGVGEEEVFAALTSAITLQLVEKTGRNRFRFRHALTVDAILASLLDPQRARLATRALDALTGGALLLPAELVELAAHLAVQADRRAEAAQYLAEEARRALSAGAVATAVASSRRAASLVPAASAEAMAADQVLLSALSAAGDTDAVEQVGRRLLGQLEEQGAPPEQQTAVRLALAKAAHASLDLAQAQRLCVEAQNLVAPGARIRTEVDLALAEIAFSAHQHAAAVAGAEAVQAEADARGYPELACAALDLLGRHRLLVTVELERAEEYLLASLRRAEQADLPLCRVRVLFQLGQLDMAHWRSRARLYEARALAEDLGLLAITAEIDHLLAICHLSTHDLDGASRYAERALAEARRYGLGELAAIVAGVRATITAARGHRAPAEREVAEALAGADSGPQIQAAISGSALVWAALADDDLTGAVRRVADTRAFLSTASTVLIQPLFLALFHGVAAVVLAANGTNDLVQGRDWAETGDVFLHASFCVARAIAAGRAGDTDQANALFAAGDGGLTKAPWLQAVYRRYAAEAALADGWGQPRPWLTAAERFFDGCGHEPLARACRSLLRVAGAPVRRARRGGFDGRHPGLALTTREADVMALVRLGLTNKQIAGRLYLSTRTVEKHVERILAKTGSANRTALAARAAAGE
jgi:predicted ATPase/DNA-binding CsgD family transcriptional regulator